MSEERQWTTAWDVGAGGERLGNAVDLRASDTPRLLHDRRIPRTMANIEHLAVTGSGVYVIDDCTGLVDGLLRQVDVVRELLDAEVPVPGVLCFVGADWPLIGGSFTTRGVQALWPKKLYPQLQAKPSPPREWPNCTDSPPRRHERLEFARGPTRREGRFSTRSRQFGFLGSPTILTAGGTLCRGRDGLSAGLPPVVHAGGPTGLADGHQLVHALGEDRDRIAGG